MQRILICGDRNWENFQLILDTLSQEHQREPVEVVIEGENGTFEGYGQGRRLVKGADLMGRAAAERLGIPVLPFAADWRKHGRAAGPIRNRLQFADGKPTLGLAFHDFLENSKGTLDMVNVMRNAGVPVKIIRSRDERQKEE